MKKKTLSSFFLLSIFIAACGGDENPCTDMTTEHVCVTVTNKSGLKIKAVTITHEKGSETLGPMEINEERSVLFNNPGENTFKTIAVFSTGDTVESRENYVEGGYKLNEVVRKNRIKSGYRSIYWLK